MDLHFEIKGKGRPIVMIHGGGCDTRDWTYLAPLLAKHYQVITFDGRGCGQSPAQTEPASYADDVLRLLNHLDIENAVLVGHSLGGQIATEFALAYPERLQRLVLIAPALSGFVHSPDLQASFQAIQEAAPDVAKMTELVVSSPFCSVIQKSPQRQLMYEMSEHNIRRMFEWAAIGAVWLNPPSIGRLHEIQAKTLFVRGTRDHEDTIKIAEHFRILPAIQFSAIEGGDHMLTLTHADHIYPEIIAFLGE